MKPIKTSYPMYFVFATHPFIAITGIFYGVWKSVFLGALLALLWLLLWLFIWKYKIEYYKNRIVIHRYIFRNVTIHVDEMDYFKEKRRQLGVDLDYGPQIITKAGKTYLLNCGIMRDQMGLLEFLEQTYNRKVVYLNQKGDVPL